jgi:hypothetical protein
MIGSIGVTLVQWHVSGRFKGALVTHDLSGRGMPDSVEIENFSPALSTDHEIQIHPLRPSREVRAFESLTRRVTVPDEPR